MGKGTGIGFGLIALIAVGAFILSQRASASGAIPSPVGRGQGAPIFVGTNGGGIPPGQGGGLNRFGGFGKKEIFAQDDRFRGTPTPILFDARIHLMRTREAITKLQRFQDRAPNDGFIIPDKG